MKFPFATYGIIAINFVIFIIQYFVAGPEMDVAEILAWGS